MGIFDNIKGVAGGSSKGVQPITLAYGERELARVVACTVKGGGRPWVGGDLVLTDHRLLFTPLNVKDVAALLSYGLKKAGAPGAVIAVVGWAAGQVMPGTVDADEIASASVGRSGALLNPPTIKVNLLSGGTLEFGILAARMSFNGAAANEVARDKFLRRIEGGR